MDNENNRLEDKKLTNDQYPMVKEDDFCPHWESSGTESLTAMRECWYCRFSDFRKNTDEKQTFSICRYSVHGKIVP